MKQNIDNVFLSHIEKDEWNEIQAYYIEKEAMWRNIGFVAIIALVIVSTVSIYFISQDKHKTLIFEKDSLGNITALGIAEKTFTIDNKMVAHQLANFIIALREVPKETYLRRRNIEIVHKMIDAKIQQSIDKKIIDQYRKASSGIINIEITSIRPLQGNRSWIINWVEHFDNEAMSYWGTTVTIERLATVEPAIQLVNPLGLFITYVNPTEDINGK